MRRSFLYASLSLTLAACGGSTTDGRGSAVDLKSQAASKIASGQQMGDPCATNHWYGDGVCDPFCPNKATEDTDCVPGGEPVVCAAFSEVSDGKCGRGADDPCRTQDPDCEGQGTPGNPGKPDDPGVVPGEPTYCAAISEVPDGKCGRAENDPCRFQDPDCANNPPGGRDCDSSKITCATLIAVTPCPVGQARTVLNGCFGECVPEAECAPIACPAIALAPDGVCSPQPEGPCQLTDPDCTDPGGGTGGSSGGGGVACAEYIEVSDGVCSRKPDDPCIFQDPDCAKR